jgi:hypothetical protein
MLTVHVNSHSKRAGTSLDAKPCQRAHLQLRVPLLAPVVAACHARVNGALLLLQLGQRSLILLRQRPAEPGVPAGSSTEQGQQVAESRVQAGGRLLLLPLRQSGLVLLRQRPAEPGVPAMEGGKQSTSMFCIEDQALDLKAQQPVSTVAHWSSTVRKRLDGGSAGPLLYLMMPSMVIRLSWLTSNILSSRSRHSLVSLDTALLLCGDSCQLVRICWIQMLYRPAAVWKEMRQHAVRWPSYTGDAGGERHSNQNQNRGPAGSAQSQRSRDLQQHAVRCSSRK